MELKERESTGFKTLKFDTIRFLGIILNILILALKLGKLPEQSQKATFATREIYYQELKEENENLRIRQRALDLQNELYQ